MLLGSGRSSTRVIPSVQSGRYSPGPGVDILLDKFWTRKTGENLHPVDTIPCNNGMVSKKPGFSTRPGFSFGISLLCGAELDQSALVQPFRLSAVAGETPGLRQPRRSCCSHYADTALWFPRSNWRILLRGVPTRQPAQGLSSLSRSTFQVFPLQWMAGSPKPWKIRTLVVRSKARPPRAWIVKSAPSGYSRPPQRLA